MTEPTELLPCPFCGSERVERNCMTPDDVACLDCDALASSVAAWNRRTPQPTQAQAGAVPLPSVELMRIVMDVEQKHHFLRGTTNWAVAVGRAIEAAHGIKGGQHGTE